MVPGRAALLVMAAAVVLAAGAGLWSLRGRVGGLPRPSTQTIRAAGARRGDPGRDHRVLACRDEPVRPAEPGRLPSRRLAAAGKALHRPALAPALSPRRAGARSACRGHRAVARGRLPAPAVPRGRGAFVDERARTASRWWRRSGCPRRTPSSKALTPQLRRDHPVRRIPAGRGDRLAAVAQSERVLIVVAPQVEALSGKSWAAGSGPGTAGGAEDLPGRHPGGRVRVPADRGTGDAPQLARRERERADPAARRQAPAGGAAEGTTGFVETVFSRDEVAQRARAGRSTRAASARRAGCSCSTTDGCLVVSGRPRLVRDDVAAGEGAPLPALGIPC